MSIQVVDVVEPVACRCGSTMWEFWGLQFPSVCCLACGEIGPGAGSKRGAILAWNSWHGVKPPAIAVRSSDADGVRYDLIPEVGLRRAAEAMAEGLRKGYPPHDWRKGIKFSEHLNHVLAHLNKFNAGDESEDHVGHAIARLMMIADHQQNMPEMDDRWKGGTK